MILRVCEIDYRALRDHTEVALDDCVCVYSSKSPQECRFTEVVTRVNFVRLCARGMASYLWIGQLYWYWNCQNTDFKMGKDKSKNRDAKKAGRFGERRHIESLN